MPVLDTDEPSVKKSKQSVTKTIFSSSLKALNIAFQRDWSNDKEKFSGAEEGKIRCEIVSQIADLCPVKVVGTCQGDVLKIKEIVKVQGPLDAYTSMSK